ncbi:YkvA family protein [Methanobrevibacter sp.]|uniref:YkvA family protein n=1 Tax=Methanobrevibacter sp. TaxID=66852 RepID=UPI003870D95E
MESTFKDFYDTLIENLETYTGEYESFIDYGPTLFKVLCNLLNEDIDRSLKLPICGAIAYYVTPEDIIPEQIYGPYGYIDDIYLSSYVLKIVASKHGFEFIQNIAPVPDIEGIILECESKSLEILKDDEIKSILDYIGL